MAAGACGAEVFSGKCVGVSDGDTVSVMRDGQAVKVRLAAIDCPESKQDYGTKAKQFTSGLVFQRTVSVDESGKDQYGRFIGTVTVNGTNVCCELVRNGLAWHYTRYSKDATLARLEKEARAAKVGVWSLPAPIPPWEFRSARKTAPPAEHRPHRNHVEEMRETGEKAK